VSFVSIPTGSPDIQPAPQAKEAPVAPAPPKPSVAEKPIPKPKVEKPIPKPIPIPKPKPVPEKSAASKALVSKLDELAKKTTPKKDKVAMVVPKPKKSILEDFESIKMKTTAEKKKKPVRKKIAKDDLAIKELEFEQLSKKSAILPSKDKPKKTSSLLKELDELEQMNQQDHAALSKPKTKQTDSKANELVKRLESIKKEKVQVKIDTSKLSSRYSQKFKSEIRNMKMAEIQKRAVAPAASGEMGDPASSALAKHVGEVYLKVSMNWKDPAGGGNGKVQISFTLFPNGKISNPKIVKSSGVSKLDNLAVLAVKNAVPLPPFPKEIKEPNLPLTFEFTYEPSKN